MGRPQAFVVIFKCSTLVEQLGNSKWGKINIKLIYSKEQFLKNSVVMRMARIQLLLWTFSIRSYKDFSIHVFEFVIIVYIGLINFLTLFFAKDYFLLHDTRGRNLEY